LTQNHFSLRRSLISNSFPGIFDGCIDFASYTEFNSGGFMLDEIREEYAPIFYATCNGSGWIDTNYSERTSVS